MSSVGNYKIYCNDENKYVSGWSVAPPSACYNNNAHDININSVQLIQTISTDTVKIKEDSILIPRNVWIKHIEFTGIYPQTSQDQYFTFKIPISMYSFTFVTDNTNKGDEFTIAVNPDTPLGLITENLNAGVTTLHAPPGLLLYGWNGFELKITDGTNTDDLGMILSIDKDTGIVEFENKTEHNFSSNNSVVKMTYYTMKNFKFGAPGVQRYGDDIIGGASPPIGTVVKFTYNNNSASGDPKNFIMSLTLLF